MSREKGARFYCCCGKRLPVVLFTDQYINRIRGRRLSYKRYTLRDARAFPRRQAAEPDITHGTNPLGTPKTPEEQRGCAEEAAPGSALRQKPPGTRLGGTRRVLLPILPLIPRLPAALCHATYARRETLDGTYLPAGTCPVFASAEERGWGWPGGFGIGSGPSESSSAAPRLGGERGWEWEV